MNQTWVDKKIVSRYNTPRKKGGIYVRILLCDDDPMILVQMEKYLKEYFQKAHLRVPDIASYTSGDALLRSESTAEIAFLDVEIPGLSGIYTGEKLKKKNPSIKIFILTSYMEYLDEAMKFHVFRYLSKPIEKARLFRNVKEALYQIEMETRLVAIETKDGVIVRQAEDIVFVETERHKTKVVTIDAVYEVNSPIRMWNDLLQIGCFYQTHRSFIVNMRYVGEFAKDTVKLNLPDGQTCSAYLTKRRYSDFKSNYLLYLESTR